MNIDDETKIILVAHTDLDYSDLSASLKASKLKIIE